MSEIDIYGVFVPSLLVFAVLGAVITAVFRRMLLAVGFYRFVWHASLFDVALFVVVVGAVFAFFTAGGGNGRLF